MWYKLAIDCQNVKIESIYDAYYLTVLRMIRMSIDNSHKENCWVGISGELGANLTFTEKFVKIGMDKFSVLPSMTLPVRRIIREIS